jgi:nodulation protein E
VVITGRGVVCALGIGTETVWASLANGRCGIGTMVHVPTERLTVKIAGEVWGFDPAAHFDTKRIAMLDRVSQFAVVASREAVAQSGLDFTVNGIGERTATIIGTAVGGMNTVDESYRKLYGENGQRVHPFTIPRFMSNAPTSHITMEHGLTGPAYTIASACASATHAIGHAYQLVRGGVVDAAVTGGAEATLTVGTMKGWEAMRVMSADCCRPFSKNRNGMVLGEGAAVFVLESLESAHARGAEILAEIIGVGMTADARDITTPDVNGAARAMSAALADARLNPEDVQYINAHGTGTAANDATETQAIHQAFGFHARRLAVSSSKSMHGHALGAAGALELLATMEALRRGVVPPTINLSEPDPACDLDYVPNTARDQSIQVALSNSFAFGGLNGVLAVAKMERH